MKLSPKYVVRFYYPVHLSLISSLCVCVRVCVCVWRRKTHFYCRLLDACYSLDTHRKLIFSCEGKARQGVTKVVYHMTVTSYSPTNTHSFCIYTQVLVQGADLEGQPFSFLKEVICKCYM